LGNQSIGNNFMKFEINKRKLLVTTALGLVLAFGIGTTANMVSRRVEAADGAERGVPTIEGLTGQAEHVAADAKRIMQMMENDPNFIPEEGYEARIRDQMDGLRSNAAVHLQSGRNEALNRLDDLIQQAGEHLTGIRELTQGRPDHPADDAVRPPVDSRPSAPPP
jgi:hypothetical protein